MAELSKQSLEDFLADVAAPTPAPGAGSSSAVTVAIAAGLVGMCARLAKRPEDGEEADRLRLRALELAEEEMTSYAPVLAARTPDDRAAALAAASEPPTQVAEAAAAVAELGATVAAASSPAVRGDALTGVTLASAASSAAARLVEINTDGSGPAFERASDAVARAARAASQ